MGRSQHKMFSDIVHLQALSCVGNCDSGLPLQFGIASFNDADASKAWLTDSNNGGAVDLTGSNQGAFGPSAINTYWSDTTNMDNLRGADITSDVAGTVEVISGNVDHTPSDNAAIDLVNNAQPP